MILVALLIENLKLVNKYNCYNRIHNEDKARVIE